MIRLQSVRELVDELKAAGRIVQARPVPRAADLACYRAVLARLVDIDARIPRPWPRAMLGNLGLKFRHMQRRAEKKRMTVSYEIARLERRRLLERDIQRMREFRTRLAE